MHSTKNISPLDATNFAKVLQGGAIYFIGIGGIGMSALAKYFLHKGATVGGYDKTPSSITEALQKNGAFVHYEENIAAIPFTPDVVIYTPAVPLQHKELVHFQSNGTTVIKRSQALGLITKNAKNICVAGTHGKTTVSTIVSHVLQYTGFGCNAFLGGISVNYNSNFLSSTNDVCVIEADEYDRSFLQLTPSMAVITSMDADHLDIYGSADAVQEGFIEFSKKIDTNGFLIAKYGLEKFDALQPVNKWSYHLSDTNATVYATNIQTDNGTYTYDVYIDGQLYTNFKLNVGGLHNIENTLAAITIAKQLDIDMELIKTAIATYKGVKRRFEYIVPPNATNSKVMIDDYAHHPTELNALIIGVHSLFPKHYKAIVFQPHLYTRTRDFATGFSESLSNVDEVVLLPIYPARELPLEGVESEMLLEKITAAKKQVLAKDALLQWVATEIKTKKQDTVLIMAGAGDIDLLLEDVKTILTN